MFLYSFSAPFRALPYLLCLSLFAVPVTAFAQQGDIHMAIAKYASPTADGAVTIRIHIACEPLPGVEDYQEGFSGASQPRSGAEGESGIDGMIICDGQARTHTARIYGHEASFVRGPASGSASVILCNLVGNDQLCVSGAASGRIIIRGPLVP